MWRQDCRMYATASCWSRRSRLAHFIARSIWSEATSSTKRTAGWLSGKQITEDDASSRCPLKSARSAHGPAGSVYTGGSSGLEAEARIT